MIKEFPHGRVILGDCLEVMPTLDIKVDMILADLPYGTTACKWDTIIPFEPLWQNYKRLIKSNGAIVLTASQPFTSALVMSNPKMFRYEYIWQKTKPTNFQNARRMPLKIHENILVFYSRLPTYNQLHLLDLPKPIKNGRKNKGANLYAGMVMDNEYMLTKTNFTNSILRFSNPSVSGHIHPTKKPEPLWEELIRIYTNEDELVLDNTAGVLTTAIACINTNRKFICIEKDETYFNKGIERIESHYEKMGLFKEAV